MNEQIKNVLELDTPSIVPEQGKPEVELDENGNPVAPEVVGFVQEGEGEVATTVAD